VDVADIEFSTELSGVSLEVFNLELSERVSMPDTYLVTRPLR
jgi:hypothetical protein